MEYFLTSSAVNTNITITLPASSGVTHFVTGIIASYSAAPTGGRMQVLDGTTTIFDIDIAITNPAPIMFPDSNPPYAVQGSALGIRLASGGATITGRLNAFGRSLL
jgi:hypothetical protein